MVEKSMVGRNRPILVRISDRLVQRLLEHVEFETMERTNEQFPLHRARRLLPHSSMDHEKRSCREGVAGRAHPRTGRLLPRDKCVQPQLDHGKRFCPIIWIWSWVAETSLWSPCARSLRDEAVGNSQNVPEYRNNGPCPSRRTTKVVEDTRRLIDCFRRYLPTSSSHPMCGKSMHAALAS